MKKLVIIFALGATFSAAAQEEKLPPVLTAASKQTAEKLEDKTRKEFAEAAKANAENTKVDTRRPDVEKSFHDVYTNREQNIYYMENSDPIITGMPAPGPNVGVPCDSPWGEW